MYERVLWIIKRAHSEDICYTCKEKFINKYLKDKNYRSLLLYRGI